MDLTPAFQEALLSAARALQLPPDQLTRFRQRQILRSLAAKTAFTKAAIEVAANVQGLRAYLREHQRDYAQLGKLGEAERDRIEGEVGACVRSCSANIDKLQAMLAGAPPPAAGASPERQAAALNSDVLAHRQGQVLILSERLRSAAALFDRLRSLRYQQLQAAEAGRLRRRPQGGGGPPQTTGELHAQLRQALVADGQRQQQQEGPPGGDRQQQQQQRQIELENQALQLELLGMNDQVQHAERTVREIATLNQMFSAAIAQQGEQIEKLYGEAVQATQHIDRANVQLGKAIRTNRSARKYMIAFFLVASLCLLFLDWWNS